MLLLVTLLATLGVAGCGTPTQTGPRAIDGVIPAQGDIAALPIRVSDLHGLIRTVSIVSVNAVPEGVSQVPDRADALFVHWIGGMCDRSAVLVLDRADGDLLITLTTERDFGGCRMMGISRALMLEFIDSIDASTVSLEQLG